MTRRRFERLMMGAGHSRNEAKYISKIGIEWFDSYETVFKICREKLIDRYNPYNTRREMFDDMLQHWAFGKQSMVHLPKEILRGKDYDKMEDFIQYGD